MCVKQYHVSQAIPYSSLCDNLRPPISSFQTLLKQVTPLLRTNGRGLCASARVSFNNHLATRVFQRNISRSLSSYMTDTRLSESPDYVVPSLDMLSEEEVSVKRRGGHFHQFTEE